MTSPLTQSGEDARGQPGQDGEDDLSARRHEDSSEAAGHGPYGPHAQVEAATDHAECHSHGDDHINRHLPADVDDVAHRQESGIHNGEGDQDGHEGPQEKPPLQASEIEGPLLCLLSVAVFL